MDKRIGNKFQLKARRRRLQSENLTDDGANTTDSLLSSPASTTPLTPASLSAMDIDESNTAYGRVRDRTMSVDNETVDTSAASETIQSQTTIDLNIKGTNDELMETHIRDCISELTLEANIDANSELAQNRRKLLDGLQELLGNSLVQVNTILPREQSRALSAYYSALSTRASFKAKSSPSPSMGARSSPLPVASVSKSRSNPVSKIILHNQRLGISSTPAKRNGSVASDMTSVSKPRASLGHSTPFIEPVVDRPTASELHIKPKLKIILRVTPSQDSS